MTKGYLGGGNALPRGRASRPSHRSWTHRTAALCILFGAMAGVFAPAAAQAPPTYTALAYDPVGNHNHQLAQGPNPPQTIQQDFWITPTMLHAYYVQSADSDLQNYATLYDFGTASYCSCYNGLTTTASHQHNDYVFSCLDGRSTVSGRLNVDIQAHAKVRANGTANPNLWRGAARLIVRGMAPGAGTAGVWAAHTRNGINPGNSTLMFAGVDADSINGIFTGPSFTVPTNSFISISVGAEVEPRADMASPGFPGSVEVGINLVKLDFPRGTPVFELPQGCTCNSARAGITNNLYRVPISVQPTKWSQVKSLYR